jgi:hypothetical protein
MPHRDERLPKTVEARVISHDPLIPDDNEGTPLEAVFHAEEVVDLNAKAVEEAQRLAAKGVIRKRDREEVAENSKEPDESAKVADANVNPEESNEGSRQGDADEPPVQTAAESTEAQDADTKGDVDAPVDEPKPKRGDQVTKASDVAPQSSRARGKSRKG